MGCANFFKYHPNATLEQYCKKFGYDEGIIGQAVKKTEHYVAAAAPNEEQRILNALLEFDKMKMTDNLYFSIAKDLEKAQQSQESKQKKNEKSANRKQKSENPILTIYSSPGEFHSIISDNYEKTKSLDIYVIKNDKDDIAFAMVYPTSAIEEVEELLVYGTDDEIDMEYFEYAVSEDDDEDRKKKRIFIRAVSKPIRKNGKAYSSLRISEKPEPARKLGYMETKLSQKSSMKIPSPLLERSPP